MLRFVSIHVPSRTQRRANSLSSLASSLNPLLDRVPSPSLSRQKPPGPKIPAIRGVDIESHIAGKAVLEHLGRRRPEAFSNAWTEIAFCFSVCMAQILTEYFLSGFILLLPKLIDELKIPTSSSVWPASSFSLVIASTLLVFGRLSDMYGSYAMYMAGLAWLMFWTVIAGFSRDQLMLNICRALQGLGPAAFLPSSVMLIGSTYRPGPRKNIVFSIYGACAVLGFFVGIIAAGAVGQYTSWGAFFWIGATLTFLTACVASCSIPSKHSSKQSFGITMDWWGSLLIVCGLVLVVFAITDSAHAPKGWATSYIIITLVAGLTLLGGAVYVEGWIAEHPLLPPDLFQVKCMKPLCLALFFNYGTTGVFLLYLVLYFQNIMGASPLQMVAWFVPLGLGGITLATTGGFLMHLIPGTLLLVISAGGWIGSSLLLALMPEGANYWAFIFPSMILTTIGIDITYNVANVFITTSMPSARQGLAGALTNSILHLSMAVLLGTADIIQTRTAHFGLRTSYRNVFWFMLGTSLVSLCLMFFFVKIEKAKSDLTADERQTLERVRTARSRSEDMIIKHCNFTTDELKRVEGGVLSDAGLENFTVAVPESIHRGARKPSEELVTIKMPSKPSPVAGMI